MKWMQMVDGWMDGWVDGWMVDGVEGRGREGKGGVGIHRCCVVVVVEKRRMIK